MTNVRILIIDDHQQIKKEVNNIEDLKIIIESIVKEMMQSKEEIRWIDLYDNDFEKTITKLLHNLGVPSNIKGYHYLREGISIIYKNPSLENITKNIYQEIAIKYNSTVPCVERAIRHAIEISWNRANYELTEEIFGYSIDMDRAKPTNSEYILTIADKLKLDDSGALLST